MGLFFLRVGSWEGWAEMGGEAGSFFILCPPHVTACSSYILSSRAAFYSGLGDLQVLVSTDRTERYLEVNLPKDGMVPLFLPPFF